MILWADGWWTMEGLLEAARKLMPMVNTELEPAEIQSADDQMAMVVCKEAILRAKPPGTCSTCSLDHWQHEHLADL